MSPTGIAGTDAGRRPWRARSLDLLVGHTLEHVMVGHTIVLSFSAGCRVLIENTVHLSGPAGRVRVVPGEPSADVLDALIGYPVRTARTCETGELQLAFGDGSELSVGIDAEVESWAVTGPDSFLLVCLARGEVAAWGGAGVTPL